MLNLGRRDGLPDPKTAQRLPLAAAPHGTSTVPHGTSTVATRPGTPLRPPPLPAIPTLDTPVSPTPARDPSASTVAPAEAPGSTLSVGPNIELKGAEISDCAILVVEGRMEATVNSTVMQIAQTGTLKGLALIDVAEIHGEFSGELTAHKKLVVHGTGRVTGIIRYGKLVVVEGGELTGDVKRLETSMAPGQPAPVRMADSSAKSTPTLTD